MSRGEPGKDLAVVADEVRTLETKSSEATFGTMKLNENSGVEVTGAQKDLV